jgi:tetratricopeptide (TPR) repeat protein
VNLSRLFNVSSWLTVRQAREALSADRPEEAQHLLEPLIAEGNRKAIREYRQVAEAYIRRANRQLKAGQIEGAWSDLLTAESLNTGVSSAIQCRVQLTQQATKACQEALTTGSPVQAIEIAGRMANRSVRSPELSTLLHVAQDWVLSAEQADRGDFLLAQDTLQKAKNRIPATLNAGLEQFSKELTTRHDRFRTAIGQMNDAIEIGQWRDAIRYADEAIAVAPDHREARSLRTKAWESFQPKQTVLYQNSPSAVPLLVSGLVGGVGQATRIHVPSVDNSLAPTRTGEGTEPEIPSLKRSSRGGKVTFTPGQPLPKRFLLWIDNVGGYLVCLAPRITFGQASADGPCDIPILAELSRLHAELFRDSEGYVLESTRDALVNGQASTRSVLRPGDRLTFGSSCQLIFHQPVPISSSARLELASGHRLSPNNPGHVLMPDDLSDQVVLYRSKEGIGLRCPGSFKVDNRPCQDRAELSLPSIVTHESFTFALEPVGPRL